MTAPLQIGAFLLSDSRIWRNSAHSRRSSFPCLESPEKECKGSPTEALPQVICVFVYHFRTPSPGGQQVSQDVMLPAFFSTYRRPSKRRMAGIFRARKRALSRGFRRQHAHVNGCGWEPLQDVCVLSKTGLSKEGISTCISRHSPLSLPLHLGLLPAVTRLASKRLSVVPSAASDLRRWAVTPLQVRQSGPGQTCFIATKTAVTAEPELLRLRGAKTSHAKHRPAAGQGGVLRSKTKRSEAPCSRNC